MDENQPERSHEQPPESDRTRRFYASNGKRSKENPHLHLIDQKCPLCERGQARVKENGEIWICVDCELSDINPEDILQEMQPILETNHLYLVLWALELFTREQQDICTQPHKAEAWHMVEHLLAASSHFCCEVEEIFEQETMKRLIERLRKENAELQSRLAQ